MCCIVVDMLRLISCAHSSCARRRGAYLGGPMAEHEVARRNVRQDRGHAAAVAAPLIVKVQPPRPHLQSDRSDDHFGGSGLIVRVALLALFRRVPCDEVWATERGINKRMRPLMLATSRRQGQGRLLADGVLMLEAAV